MIILETKTLTRRFGLIAAVDNLTISLQKGEIFGLLGPNGAGKTTAIKMLTTLLPPTSGQATVAGFDIRHQPAQVRRNIGYVPQMISVDGNLSAYENLLISAKLYDIPRMERESRVRSALSWIGLEDIANKLVRTFSGGMIRRLEIAQAILHRPPILFLDEPTVGLDPLARKAVGDHVKRLPVDYGTTVLLTTHLMDEADNLCTRIAIMHRGSIVATGTPEEMKESIGGNGASLDDVFVHYTGDKLESGVNYRETTRTRRTAQRLG